MDSSHEFPSAKMGDIVVIEEDSLFPINGKEAWWIGQIIYAVSGARSSSSYTIFQVINIDTGLIKEINSDLVIKIL